MSILRGVLQRRLALPLLRAAPASFSLVNVRPSTTTQTQVNQSREWMAKNEALKRPMSPVMIYKLQLTMLLSGTHRATGFALSVLVYSWGLSQLGSSSTNFANQLAALQSALPSSMIFLLKFLTVTSLAYHTLNGCRHLAWDLGYGFGLRELYTSGYLVLALTLLVAIGTLAYY